MPWESPTEQKLCGKLPYARVKQKQMCSLSAVSPCVTNTDYIIVIRDYNP